MFSCVCRPGRSITGLFEVAAEQGSGGFGSSGHGGSSACASVESAAGIGTRDEESEEIGAEQSGACNVDGGADSTARRDAGAGSVAGLCLPAAAGAGDSDLGQQIFSRMNNRLGKAICQMIASISA